MLYNSRIHAHWRGRNNSRTTSASLTTETFRSARSHKARLGGAELYHFEYRCSACTWQTTWHTTYMNTSIGHEMNSMLSVTM
jgi:hypothetical protein